MCTNRSIAFTPSAGSAKIGGGFDRYSRNLDAAESGEAYAGCCSGHHWFVPTKGVRKGLAQMMVTCTSVDGWASWAEGKAFGVYLDVPARVELLRQRVAQAV